MLSQQVTYGQFQPKFTTTPVPLCDANKAQKLSQIVKRISVKENLRRGESLLCFA